MDHSTHTDGYQQQNHHHQYQQHHHLQQQQQQQHIASQAYEPSQVQPSDQAYYTYPHQYDQQHTNQQQYPYYPPEYANFYQQQPHHETTSIHPPGVPIPPETTTHLVAPEYGQTHVQNQQNAYYPQGVVEQQHQYQQWSNSDSGGLNPVATTAAAAVDAFSQSTQWQGNGGGFGPMPVHDGSGSMRPPIGQSPYRGGGRRGGRPFRGGSWGHSGFRPDRSAPTFRGRGRGRGGGRFAPSEGPTASIQGEAPQALMLPPSASGPGQAPFPAPAQAHATSFWPPPRMAWCELCRVDCNTVEILEQHKNGKRHKKNLQVYEELQNLNKLITGMQNQPPPEKVEGFDEKRPPPENLPSEAVSDDKSEVSVSELTEEPERKPRMDHFEGRERGFKRTMRGGRGGKRIRTIEGPRRPVEPPKPKQVIPLICELCNVKCDSQVVFDSHLAGKKHLSNLKRFHGYQAILGAVVLQALCQPNPNAPSTSFIPQVHHQGVHGPQDFSSQPMPYMLPQAQAQPAEPVPVLEAQDQQDSKLHGSQAIPVPAVSNDTETENGTLELEGKVLSATATDKAIVIPKDEVSYSDQGVLPGLDCKMEEPESKNEEPTD